MLSLLLLGSLSACSKDKATKVEEEESLDLLYFELRSVNDTGVLMYDMRSNEGSGGRFGDVVWTIDIVDPTYYGKVSNNVLEQVQNMTNQIDLENQMNQLYDNPEIEGKGVVSNVNLFCSTEYTMVENVPWAFCMQNYDVADTHVNSMFGVTEWNNHWIVFNILSEFDNDSPNLEINKQVYAEFYRVFNLAETLLDENTVYNI